MSGDASLSYIKAGYKSTKWNWVLNLQDKQALFQNTNLIAEKISKSNLLQTYGLNKPPKLLPCRKKCFSNPWCLVSISKESKCSAARLTEQLRDMKDPVGLQNTANTCWINSALQALFHIQCFRNCIYSIEGFGGEENLTSLDYLLQAMFVEMELHKNKALACSPGSVFEKLAIFVTKEIMQKDQDFEVLKCVSEFLENTIDNLLGNPRTGPIFSPLFRTSVQRIAKWKCSSCGKEHVRQLAPDTCYTMAAYVSADECPLDQCILDLQTETQTGVSLTCVDGCRATVKVDRVVTPQISTLPSLLIIRNNSLIDREIKRRLHVIYPEALDLTKHTCSSERTLYSLRSVIYHHGHWIKHFSAHVKTEDGKWYNFNDEKVSTLVNRPGSCLPQETHKDYFSIANVANKYKNRSKMRVSRGAFIWIYERDLGVRESFVVQPPNAVVDYVLSKQNNKQTTDIQLIQKMKTERESIYERLPIDDVKQNTISIISRSLLCTWYSFQDVKFVPQPSLLREGICEHRKIDPLKSCIFKCIKNEEGERLLKDECGIHCEEKIPLIFRLDEAFCGECVSRHVHHILFREHLKEIQKKTKKMASKEQITDTTFIGSTTMGNWTKIALNSYLKETGLDDIENSSDEESENGSKSPHSNETSEVEKKEEQQSSQPECKSEESADSSKISNTFKENGVKQEENISCFNEEIVCVHNMIDPKVSGVWLPVGHVNEIKKFCEGLIHPATLTEGFDVCNICKIDMDRTLETCDIGKIERKGLYHLLLEKKRPHTTKDSGKQLFLLSRDFLSEWKTFVRMCVKDDPTICKPTCIKNSILICKHQHLLYPCELAGSLSEFAVLIWEEEWNILVSSYAFDYCIKVKFSGDGILVPDIGVCSEGCVEEEAAKRYENQFDFEYESINVRQVNSELDVPTNAAETEEDTQPTPKKARLAATKSTVVGTSLRTATQRLVRASKPFSSSDTIKEIQNFIADRTGIWPLLQTLWLSGGKEHGPGPLRLTDKHRSMTLKSLRIKPGDTIYFRASQEDMEKAAGDGESEYNEIEIEED